MINGIIISNNFNMIKSILNNVDFEISYKIATDEHDFKNFTNNKKADIIFIDSKSGLNPMSKVFDKYQSNIILVNDEKELTNGLIDSKIHEITRTSNDNDKRDKIMTELQDLGYSTRHQGTYYLVDIISEVIKSPNFVDNNLQNILYPLVAKKYGKSAYNIKSSVHKATECMYYECDVNKLQKYFRFCEDTKPTVKEVIFAVSNNV